MSNESKDDYILQLRHEAKVSLLNCKEIARALIGKYCAAEGCYQPLELRNDYFFLFCDHHMGKKLQQQSKKVRRASMALSNMSMDSKVISRRRSSLSQSLRDLTAFSKLSKTIETSSQSSSDLESSGIDDESCESSSSKRQEEGYDGVSTDDNLFLDKTTDRDKTNGSNKANEITNIQGRKFSTMDDELSFFQHVNDQDRKLSATNEE